MEPSSPSRRRPSRPRPSSSRPIPKRPRTTLLSNHFDRLPIELVYKIFSFLTEKELCILSKTCRAFRQIESDSVVWEHHFKSVYSLSRPIEIKQNEVSFLSRQETSATSWKKSFLSLLARSYHVGLPETIKKNRPYLKTLPSIACLADNEGSESDLILLHEGDHQLLEPITVRRRGTLIGCALGPVGEISKRVKIRTRIPDNITSSLSMITFDAANLNIRNLSIELSQLSESQVADFDNERYFCLVQIAQSEPTFNNCLFSTSNAPIGYCVHVWGERAEPHFGKFSTKNFGFFQIFIALQSNSDQGQKAIENL